MIESMREYWYLYIVLVVMIGVLIFISIKAGKAVKRRRSSMEKQRAELERYRHMVETYRGLTPAQAEEADACELVEGVAAVLQYEIERSEKGLTAAFKEAEPWRQRVYAVWYFIEDTETGLSFFFRNNGRPVTALAVEMIRDAGQDKLYLAAKAMFPMYDEENDRVSLDKKTAAQLDETFPQVYDKRALCEGVKAYILENIR